MTPRIEMAVVTSNNDDSLTLHLVVGGQSKDMTIRRGAAVSLVNRMVEVLSRK